MRATAFLAAIRSIEQLYESVVGDPASWTEQALADWVADTLADTNELPKEAQKEVRRGLRAAQKLQKFWSDDQSAVSDHGDWRSKVDIALGARAWRPLLDLARIGLDTAPSEELFAQVKERFALVHADRWMDGVSYEEWRGDN